MAADIVVSNVAFCMKISESSATFRKLCDKDQLNMPDSVATKNDGREIFFEVRDLVFVSGQNLLRVVKSALGKLTTAFVKILFYKTALLLISCPPTLSH